MSLKEKKTYLTASKNQRWKGKFSIPNILSRVLVTIDGVMNGNWIYLQSTCTYMQYSAVLT
jgi:hypothetical protein